ncbi:MAG TPA: tetratricopeptide repeat protein, partial [Tepidisphaeraceae bacterium]|nr:tetratricopeptide repeat protein [Tepidisphaeraceae bacterium]
MASSLDEMLDNIMAACGGRADEALGRGDALFAQGQFHKALVHFMAAKKLRPGAECDYRIGLAYWRVGDLASARGAFEQAVQAKENFGEAQCELGRVYLALGNIQSAIAHARRAVEIAPDNRDFAVAWASVLEADGQSDAAGEIVARILRGGDASVDLALVFARLAPGLHREEHALELIAQNLRQSSGSAQRSALHFAAANLLDRLGRYDEAFEQATDANALRGVRYDPPQVEASFQHWIDCFDRAAVARMPRAT